MNALKIKIRKAYSIISFSILFWMLAATAFGQKSSKVEEIVIVFKTHFDIGLISVVKILHSRHHHPPNVSTISGELKVVVIILSNKKLRLEKQHQIIGRSLLM
ncbi:MAG: hypothetical protein WCL21_05580 [Mariniphaga sp.]